MIKFFVILLLFLLIWYWHLIFLGSYEISCTKNFYYLLDFWGAQKSLISDISRIFHSHSPYLLISSSSYIKILIYFYLQSHIITFLFYSLKLFDINDLYLLWGLNNNLGYTNIRSLFCLFRFPFLTF